MDDNPQSPPFNADSDPPAMSPRSPVRPKRPDEPFVPRGSRQPVEAKGEREAEPTQDPHQALAHLRQKMETLVTEYAQGLINRAQFNAVYARYSEQRAIIERLVERNPESKAWQQVINSRGHTRFLRQHFEATPLYFGVFRHDSTEPLLTGGKTAPDAAQTEAVLQALWTMPNRPQVGLARKALPDDQWLLLALGPRAVTLVMFLLEPSMAQAALVRDLHADFERANESALAREVARPERMVFPQRALVETGF